MTMYLIDGAISDTMLIGDDSKCSHRASSELSWDCRLYSCADIHTVRSFVQDDRMALVAKSVRELLSIGLS